MEAPQNMEQLLKKLVDDQREFSGLLGFVTFHILAKYYQPLIEVYYVLIKLWSKY